MFHTYLLIFSLLGLLKCSPQFADSQALNSEDWTLVWSDEFDYKGLPDSTKWSYNVGQGCNLPCGCGWGNHELQYYTEDRLENARVENGKLIIEAIKENFENAKYSSARITSQYKADWKYGRVEIRAIIPSGLGVWGAIWMLPTDSPYGNWPASGEIDIMEHVGFEPDTIFGTVHTKAYNGMIGTQVGGKIYEKKAESDFQNYAIEWTKDKIDFFVNESKFFTFKNEGIGFAAWPFDQAFYLIMNIAVGGDWGASRGFDESIWPQKMEIDYVRVYQ